MVYGIGTDIIQTARIAASLERIGARFAAKILGADELLEYHQRQCASEVRALHYLCTRYAAKEAFSKALHTGMRAPMSWHAMQVLNDELGAPYIVTHDGLAQFMQLNELSASISLSDEIDYAVAFVLIEKN